MTPSPVSPALQNSLARPESLTIALSGGIDSLTLSAAAALARGRSGLQLCHAVSPAVPKAATARVKWFAEQHGLDLRIVDAGEFADPVYRSNPVNRCYFCKSNLYGTLSRLGAVVAAGTNLDDLSDYRPGLEAAAEHDVLHPFVEARMAKFDVRQLARELGLGDLADLPAAPCLASRIETGLRVEPADLVMIDRVEEGLRAELGPINLRCRRTKRGWVIEIDAATLTTLTDRKQAQIQDVVATLTGSTERIALAAYRRGSGFVHG